MTARGRVAVAHILPTLLHSAGGVSLDLGPSQLLRLLQRTRWLPTTDGALAEPHEAVARTAAMLQVSRGLAGLTMTAQLC